MNAKTQKSNLSPEKILSTSFLIWIISGLYLLPMVWFLLVAFGARETKPWLAPAVAALTVSYGILMLLFWPHEKSLV
jgi:membrane protein YdbS with pleckstrin-like domain